jgi:hypothetical protein
MYFSIWLLQLNHLCIGWLLHIIYVAKSQIVIRTAILL